MNIACVMELGGGDNSTPFFIEHCARVITIETNQKWVDKLCAKYEENTNWELYNHGLFPALSNTKIRRWQTPQDTLMNACNYYRNWINIIYNLPRPRLLFIDCISPLRRDALELLHRAFDVVTYHDCQDNWPARPGYKNHSYVDDPDLGTFKPDPIFSTWFDKTNAVWTGLLLKDQMAIGAITYHATKYDKNFNIEAAPFSKYA